MRTPISKSSTSVVVPAPPFLQVQPVAKGWIQLCQADYTMDGLLDIFDIFAFLDVFNAGDPAGDFNADGVFDVFDVFAYLDAFNAGCP